MKSKKIQSSKEQGQAIVEMCICMIPILAVFIGMIFISGLGISNIRAFVTAKANAELSSRLNNAVGGYGDSIHHWDYGEDEDEDSLPFTADDSIVNFNQANSTNNAESLINYNLNATIYSQSLSSGPNSLYVFRPISSLLSANDNFAQNPPDTMLAAADLVEGRADSDLSKVFLTDTNQFSADETRSLNLSFGDLFGIQIDDIDLRDMRANIVYYPALPSQGTTSSLSP